MSNLREIRTMEEVAYLLNILFTNMNNLNKAYYDIFINPVPMDVELERYDEEGKLITVVIPNRAKDKMPIYKGQGSPNGVQIAEQGSFYLDVLNRTLYFKGNANNDAYGWQFIWCQNNLQQRGGGTTGQFLAPDGDGEFLSNISASSINKGVLKVERGGTGGYAGEGDRYFTSGSLLMGNGYNPIKEAVEGVDYLGSRVEDSFIGMIAYFPKLEPKEGWLVCDGTSYNSSVYPKLSRYLTGSDDISGMFSVPDLRASFIRCFGTSEDNKSSGAILETQEESVGNHNHEVSGYISLNPHSHEVPLGSLGNMLRETSQTTNKTLNSQSATPKIEIKSLETELITTSAVGIDASFTAMTNDNVGGENRPENKALVPMIRCDIIRGN